MMKAKKVCEAQNAFGRFMQLYNLGQVQLAAPLFCSSPQVSLWLPDYDISAIGPEAVAAALKKLSDSRRTSGYRRDVHVPHTAVYWMSEDGTTVMGTWDIFTYLFSGPDTAPKIEYVYGRTDVQFAEEDGVWKILNLDWYQISSFVPWDYDPAQDDGLCTDLDALPLPPAYIGKTSPSDFYKIQNILTRFIHNNRRHAMEDTFAQEHPICFRMPPLTPDFVRGHEAVAQELGRLRQLEEKNIGKYVYVPTTSAPVIEVSEDGETAEGQWMMASYSFEGEAFGKPAGQYDFVRRLGILRASFVKEHGSWRMTAFDCDTLLRVPAMRFDADYIPGRPVDGKGYMRMARPESQWKPALPKLSGDFPDDAVLLEGQMAYWINAYRRGEMPAYIKEHMVNDEYEIGFTSRGQGLEAPPVVGTESMLARFTMPAFQYHHQQVTCHGGMCPDVEITEDGRYATVTYFDYNTSAYIPTMNYDKADTVTLHVPDNFDADSSPFEHTPCVHQFSKYEHTFAKVNGEWKHLWCNWETLVRLRDICLAGKESRGWAGSVTQFKYPAIGQKYEYSPIRKAKKDASSN